jgi:hypothetical protein
MKQPRTLIAAEIIVGSVALTKVANQNEKRKTQTRNGPARVAGPGERRANAPHHPLGAAVELKLTSRRKPHWLCTPAH